MGDAPKATLTTATSQILLQKQAISGILFPYYSLLALLSFFPFYLPFLLGAGASSSSH